MIRRLRWKYFRSIRSCWCRHFELDLLFFNANSFCWGFFYWRDSRHWSRCTFSRDVADKLLNAMIEFVVYHIVYVNVLLVYHHIGHTHLCWAVYSVVCIIYLLTRLGLVGTIAVVWASFDSTMRAVSILTFTLDHYWHAVGCRIKRLHHSLPSLDYKIFGFPSCDKIYIYRLWRTVIFYCSKWRLFVLLFLHEWIVVCACAR